MNKNLHIQTKPGFKKHITMVACLGALFCAQGSADEQVLNRHEVLPQGVPAPARPVVQRSNMNMTMLKAEESNGAYLNTAVVPAKEKSLNAILFDPKIANEMSAKYESLSKTYELKKAYRLDRREDQLQYESANKELVDWTMKKMLQFHADSSVRKVPQDTGAGKTVGSAAKAYQALQNTTMKLGEDTKAKFKYDIPHGAMMFGVTSPVVNTTLDYHTRPINASVGSSGEEKLNLRMDKQLKQISASTNARYGLRNQTLNYGLDKHLAGPFSAGVAQYQDLRDSSKNETIGRLNFGMVF